MKPPRPKPLALAVRLTPKGGRDAIEGWTSAADGKRRLKARVSASPQDGKANVALIALLARFFAVPKSAVAIASGAASRYKNVEIAGDVQALRARLDALGEVD